MVGVTAAWTIPLVQVVSMTPAHADSPSAPPGPPTNNPPQPPGSTIPVQPTEATSTATTHSAPSSSAAIGTTSAKPENPQGSGAASGGLPFTGANPLPALGVGAAAVALGVGAIAASQLVRDKSEQPEAE
ncbi:MAG TPA: hypothetical protein VFD94_07930 [Jatrophihabitans sp.]|nr:hypothetical protein [Jatrophihabitans sp.]